GYRGGQRASEDGRGRKAFRDGVGNRGYKEGQPIRRDDRLAAGGREKLWPFGAEFSSRNVDVVFAFTAGATQAAAKAMPAKPIVSIIPIQSWLDLSRASHTQAATLPSCPPLREPTSTANIWNASTR